MGASGRIGPKRGARNDHQRIPLRRCFRPAERLAHSRGSIMRHNHVTHGHFTSRDVLLQEGQEMSLTRMPLILNPTKKKRRKNQ